jgi:glycosyltransferase involved in cell wall biosynthesis
MTCKLKALGGSVTMKRILQVVGGMNVGGTETMLMNVYRNINRDEVQFDFISYYTDDGYFDKEIKKLGGRVIKIPSPSTVGAIKALGDLCKVVKKYGPYDAIHCHTLFNCGLAVLAGYISRVKIRISHSHTTCDVESSVIKKIYIGIMKRLIKVFSTHLLACSKNAAIYLFGKNAENNPKYTYIPNFIEYRKFITKDPADYVAEELGIQKQDKVVGHIGRFIDAKNHKFIIEVMVNMISKDERVKGILVGEGVLKEEVQQAVKRLGLENRIIFLGIREDIPDILKVMDLFIFPSIYEGLGLVLLEAQAAGLPCLVSEAIQPEADIGIGLVNRFNLSEGAEKWADKGLELLGKKGLNSNLILNGFEAKGYSINNILDKLSNIYNIEVVERAYEKSINSLL